MSILGTRNDWSLTVLRLTLGIAMLPHGLQKTLGLFGGQGFTATMDGFVGRGMPAWLAFLVILAESAGALGLLAGLLTRIAAFGIGCVMVGAILLVHLQHGFFMNWHGTQAGEGFEYHLLALGIAIALVLSGGGARSLDLAISERA